MFQPLSIKLLKETQVGQPCGHRNGVQQDTNKHATWVESPIGLRSLELTGFYRSVFCKIMYSDVASNRLSDQQDNMHAHHLEPIWTKGGGGVRGGAAAWRFFFGG